MLIFIFQDALQKMRQIDDKIIYLLNTKIPTESFKGQSDPKNECKGLYDQIQSFRSQRYEAISTCLNVTKQRVQQLKEQRDAGRSDIDLTKNLRKEQNKLRLLQSELNVEDIVKQRTDKVYHEKCRSFYNP